MNSKAKIAILSVAGVAVLAGLVFLVQSVLFAREKVKGDDKHDLPEATRPKLENVNKAWFATKAVDPALRLTEENIKGLRLITAEVAEAKSRPLPPQVGTLNYDNETMFIIKPRFQGELATMLKVKDKIIDQNGSEKIIERPIKFGDKVKQGDVLAVFWSQTLGVAKAALVDAMCSLRLSEATLARHQKLFDEGSLALNTLEQTKRQVQSDSLAVLTAERTLRMWKLSNDEIKTIKDEANVISDTKKARDAALEAEKWARTEVIVPWFDKANKDRELTVLEKNTNIGDIVDNANYGTWLFRVADMSELQIWVHPPEEFLPLIRTGLKKNGGLTWEIRFQSEPDAPPHVLRVDRIAPSIEPNQHNPMVVGYMPNPEHKYIAGQFVTATLYLPPEPDTCEIPTDAINESKGQSFVFVKDKANPNQFALRRVAVVRRYADYTIVRTKLREQDEKYSADELKAGRFPLRTLARGEQVVTRGVIELTTALENALIKEAIKQQQE